MVSEREEVVVAFKNPLWVPRCEPSTYQPIISGPAVKATGVLCCDHVTTTNIRVNRNVCMVKLIN